MRTLLARPAVLAGEILLACGLTGAYLTGWLNTVPATVTNLAGMILAAGLTYGVLTQAAERVS